MAATRERRSNAGSKLARLLDEEEDDDFYKTTYGGFNEEEEDNDFQFVDEDAPDEVDSDFSIDENDEVISDAEDEEKSQKKVNRCIKHSLSEYIIYYTYIISFSARHVGTQNNISEGVKVVYLYINVIRS